MLLPFSNQITGPVPVPESLNDTFSGSGSGSGLQNSTDYCGNDLSSTSVSVNENSVKRIPVYIWAVVIGIFVFMVAARFVVVSIHLVFKQLSYDLMTIVGSPYMVISLSLFPNNHM